MNGLSFSVRAGEMYALLGANGAGKTTALRWLATLLTPTGGAARVDGYTPRSSRSRSGAGSAFSPPRWGSTSG